MEKQDCPVSLYDIHIGRLLSRFRPRHARVKGSDSADKPAGKAIITNGLHLVNKNTTVTPLCVQNVFVFLEPFIFLRKNRD